MDKIVFITNFWGSGIIPAILLDQEKCILPQRTNVWIPDGYEGAGGYSTRKSIEILEFNGNEEMKKDVMQKWSEEQYRVKNRNLYKE